MQPSMQGQIASKASSSENQTFTNQSAPSDPHIHPIPTLPHPHMRHQATVQSPHLSLPTTRQTTFPDELPIADGSDSVLIFPRRWPACGISGTGDDGKRNWRISMVFGGIRSLGFVNFAGCVLGAG
ncbi:hypothetical protein L484_007709 [Morus notabilis]|uniref:Uncharacterized protein n=1 Tax=Morus notabilis TaxID=981085 RepID=W9RXK8_9ROSA|nr:hypothetical protein L484_007709 [Morus notabilis]